MNFVTVFFSCGFVGLSSLVGGFGKGMSAALLFTEVFLIPFSSL